MFKTELINQFADIKKINALTLWFLAFDNIFFLLSTYSEQEAQLSPRDPRDALIG